MTWDDIDLYGDVGLQDDRRCWQTCHWNLTKQKTQNSCVVVKGIVAVIKITSSTPLTLDIDAKHYCIISWGVSKPSEVVDVYKYIYIHICAFPGHICFIFSLHPCMSCMVLHPSNLPEFFDAVDPCEICWSVTLLILTFHQHLWNTHLLW